MSPFPMLRLAAGLLVLPLAACAAADSGPSSGGSAADSVVGPQGNADPGVVVALDDFVGVAALALGVTPDVTYDVFGYESSAAILGAQGAGTAAYGGELDIERVAAQRPDVIIGVSIPTTVTVAEQLGAIADTTIVEYTDSWQDQLRAVGQALGREDRADQLIAEVEADTAALAAELAAAGMAGTSVSVLGENEGMFSPPAGSGVGSVIAEVGLTRPAAQEVELQADSPFVQVSEETLTDHDADRVYLLSGGAYRTEPLTTSPLWGSLAAVERGAVSEASAELWLASSAFSTWWVIDDLRRTLVEGADAKPVADAAAEFERFLAN